MPVGKSPIGIAFGILWFGSVVRVNVATLKGVAFGISRTITKRLDLTSGFSLGFRLRPHNGRDPSLRCDRQTWHQKNVRSAPLVRKKGDFSGEGEGRLDEVSIEFAPSESSGLTRWTGIQSQQVTSLSTVNLLKKMASEVDSEKSQLTPVHENHL